MVNNNNCDCCNCKWRVDESMTDIVDGNTKNQRQDDDENVLPRSETLERQFNLFVKNAPEIDFDERQVLQSYVMDDTDENRFTKLRKFCHLEWLKRQYKEKGGRWLTIVASSYAIGNDISSIAEKFPFVTSTVTFYGFILLSTEAVVPKCVCMSDLNRLHILTQLLILILATIAFTKQNIIALKNKKKKNNDSDSDSCSNSSRLSKRDWINLLGELFQSLVALYILLMFKSLSPWGCWLGIKNSRISKLYSVFLLSILGAYVKLKPKVDSSIKSITDESGTDSVTLLDKKADEKEDEKEEEFEKKQEKEEKKFQKVQKIIENQSKTTLMSFTDMVEKFEDRAKSKHEYWAHLVADEYSTQVSLSILYAATNGLISIAYDQCETCHDRGEYCIRWVSFGIIYLFLPSVVYYYKFGACCVCKTFKNLCQIVLEMIVLFCLMSIYSTRPFGCHCDKRLMKLFSFCVLLCVLTGHWLARTFCHIKKESLNSTELV